MARIDFTTGKHKYHLSVSSDVILNRRGQMIRIIDPQGAEMGTNIFLVTSH